MAKKVAVIIFNLGGPDEPSAIQPFLFNLFNDPLIFGLPSFIRTPLAKFISKRRAPKVAPTYAEMGGKSPIQDNTLAQAAALQAALADTTEDVRIFTAQRYWHPMAPQVVSEVEAYGADAVILLPLYPQLSTTTTISFVKVWQEAAAAQQLSVPTKTICCYPTLDGFIQAQAALIRPVLAEAKKHGRPRILFSAHGLPEYVVKRRGDPYPIQVQSSAAAIAAALGEDDLDWVVSYQSRVGPAAWIKPYTEPEIRRAGAEKVPLLVVPLAFVSEHLETLVELDVEYQHVADACGVPFYGRVNTVGVSPDFIQALASEVKRALKLLGTHATDYIAPHNRRVCPSSCKACPHTYAETPHHA